MSNHANNVNLHVFIVDKELINETTMVEIFDIDSDFSDNEDYFREETIEAGLTESQVCAKEIYDACKHIADPMEMLKAMMDMLPEYSNGEQSFLVGNTTYCGDYKIQLHDVFNKIVVCIAYVGD